LGLSAEQSTILKTGGTC